MTEIRREYARALTVEVVVLLALWTLSVIFP
jgi:hypothetical protein